MMTNFKIGDYIAAYTKGIHQVVNIIPRYKMTEYPFCSYQPTDIDLIGEFNPVIVYKQLYSLNGKPVESDIRYDCDSSLCKPANLYILEKIEEFHKHIELLNDIYYKINVDTNK